MALQMHKAKKTEKELQNRKALYSDIFLVAATQTPPIQHQKFSFTNSDTSKKETVQNAFVTRS
jgi:hypothetical protein